MKMILVYNMISFTGVKLNVAFPFIHVDLITFSVNALKTFVMKGKPHLQVLSGPAFTHTARKWEG